ncbi:hypothetical protein [Actinomycetospora cinnamomea]|uniref:Uncharacterized protein n=1 Tax=Actinomycetospora cinnamomea TaxID=663609 RepID=A0A2U1F3Z9_9PSEU|nr:hypothetical protein [Actinomycetospora cinnamomea]PVZ06888.1 hypothetical protein C8D89_11281 [Actinomycetospora cinnamomea]
MSETVRSASLSVAALASLLIVSIGLAALVETDDPDWLMLILGLVAFTFTVLPLLLGRSRERRRTAGREA